MIPYLNRCPATSEDPDVCRIHGAWAGRISGCLLGRPLEVLSFRKGLPGLRSYLADADAYPLRGYVPLLTGTIVEQTAAASCRGNICRAEPDDDINYTVLALLLLEDRGLEFDTADVARAWLRLLPAGMAWTAERAAYRTLLVNMDDEFVNGARPGFDLSRCSDNPCNEWIGAQIRADLYGWVCPGRPALAADLALRDAALSHRGEGLHGAAFVASLAAMLPVSSDIESAIDAALEHVPFTSDVYAAVQFGRKLAKAGDAVEQLHARFDGISPVHTVNNLSLVVWALCSAAGDFDTGICNAVMAGWDTDCNAATVGGLLGLAGAPIAEPWTRPWAGRVAVGLAGHSELQLEDLVARTVAVAERLRIGATA